MALTTIDDRGLKTPIDLLDNEQIRFGTGNDLVVYHNGSHSYIHNTNGNLVLYGGAGSSQAVVTQAVIGENAIIANANGSVDLYYDNSKKLETHTNGINVTGRIWATGTGGYGYTANDDVKSSYGTGNDLQIYHDATDSWLKNTTGDLVIENTGDDIVLIAQDDIHMWVQNSSGSGEERAIIAAGNGQVELYYDGTLKCQTTSTGATVSGGGVLIGDNSLYAGFGTHTWAPKTQVHETQGAAIVRSDDGVWGGSLHLAKSRGSYSSPSAAASGDRAGAVYFEAHDGGDFLNYVAGIEAFITDTVGTNDTPGKLVFSTTADGTNGLTERLTITSAGNVQIPNDSGKLQLGASQDLEIYHTGAHAIIDNNTGATYIKSAGMISLNPADTEDGALIKANGAVELMYDNVKKFETVSWGAIVTGALQTTSHVDLAADNAYVKIGASADLNIYHNGTDSFIENSTGSLYIRDTSGGDVRIQGKSGEDSIICHDDGAVELFHDNNKKMSTTSSGIKIEGSGGDGISIENSGGTNAACINLKNTLANYVREYRLAVAGSDGAYGSANSLFVRDLTAGATRLELNNSGDVKVSSGDITFGTTGKGIVLGNTSNVDANTLDDYEEGEYNPTITCDVGGSYSLSSSYDTLAYTKIGRLVHIQGYLSITGESSPDGTLRISLPVTTAALTENADYSGFSILVRNHGTSNIHNQVGVTHGNGSYFNILADDGSGNSFYLTHGSVDTAWQVFVSGTYVAA